MGFQELHDRVVPVLYAWIQLRVRRSPNANLDPQDILQEVWLRALRGLDGYDPTCSFRGWILGIAKNVLLQGYQKLGWDPAPGAGFSSGINLPDSQTSVSLHVSKDESLKRFIRYVEALEADDRTLLIYCGLEEYTSAQVAARMGISSEAAGKRWQVLRARLRQSGILEKLAGDLVA